MDTVSINAPFPVGAEICEFGGGDRPVLRPNYDVRPGPHVDAVIDFNRPLPISSNRWDGIVLKFCIEHISWKNIQQFCNELHRVLRPGGTLYIITANTLEQCRRIVTEGEFTLDTECMLFGGQGYPEDTHTCAWSPALAEKRFHEASFVEVQWRALPGCDTDMEVWVRKSSAVVAYGWPDPEKGNDHAAENIPA